MYIDPATVPTFNNILKAADNLNVIKLCALIIELLRNCIDWQLNQNMMQYQRRSHYHT